MELTKTTSIGDLFNGSSATVPLRGKGHDVTQTCSLNFRPRSTLVESSTFVSA